MSDHTPTNGPWQFSEFLMEIQAGSVTKYCVLAETTVTYPDVSEEEAIANGKLMAAAPQLLAACIAVANWIDEEYPIWDIPEDLPMIRLRQKLYDAITKTGIPDPQDDTE